MEVHQLGRLRTCSESLKDALRILEEVAATDTTVLILGETGTGKELAAEAVHESSPRSQGPYMVVDCAAVPKDLIESELFGHAKGAFTGATAERKGAFEAAHEGTVFIDEIGELPLDLQSRMLRVLERRQVKRVGENITRKVDVRIVAATNRDLAREVERGTFRQDLYFRLNVVMVRLPPLRERPDDIELLARQFLLDAPAPFGEALELKDDALARLKAYAWPGNVRELRNIIDRGASVSDSVYRVPDDLERAARLHQIDNPLPYAPGMVEAPPKPPAAELSGQPPGRLTEPLWRDKTYKDARDAVMEDFERGYLLALLETHRGNVSAAARAAGIHRNILHRMMARYGIQRGA